MENKDLPPVSDLYKVTRGQIEHVNNIVSQRVIWLVIAQSFFFSAFAILCTGNPEDPHLKGMQGLLMNVLPITSLIACILSYIDILASLGFLRKVMRFYKAAQKNQENEQQYPPVSGWKANLFFEHASPAAIPIVFIIIWIIIFLNYSSSL